MEEGVTGIKKWAREYRQKLPDLEKIKREIGEFMKVYDEKQAENKIKEKLTKNTPDDDGWIKVTRTGKKKGIPRKESIEEKILAKEKDKLKKLESQNFYKFQIRDTKMRNLEELRQKFEEDKKRIALIRTKRKFKPY